MSVFPMRPLLFSLALLAAAPALAQGPQYRARGGSFALTDCLSLIHI